MLLEEDKKILKEYLSSKLKPVKFIENEDLLLLEIIDNEWNFVREEENTKGIIYFKDSDISCLLYTSDAADEL